MIPDSQAFMDMLENKDRMLTSLFSDLETSGKNAESFKKLEALYRSGAQVNQEKALLACATSLRHANELNQRLVMILLVYAGSTTFSSDCSSILNKMGRGQEALRARFSDLLKGNTE